MSFHGGEEISHALKSDEKVTLDASYIPLIDAAVLFRTFSNLHNARKKTFSFQRKDISKTKYVCFAARGINFLVKILKEIF